MADSTTGTSGTTKAPTSDVAPLPSPDTQTPATTPPAPAATDVPGTTTTPTAIGQSLPSNAPQQFEFRLQNPPEPKSDIFEAKVVIPWIVAIVGWGVAIVLYRLTRRNKINDDLNDIVIEDIKAFLEKMEELTRLVASHQGGCPCHGADLKESREHLTKLRQAAVAVSNRVDKALLNQGDRDEWKTSFRVWKTATERNTDWITNKTKKWSRENMLLLEQANEEYTGKIINFRNRIVTRKIKLKA